jgi:hypothetical protein
LKSKTELIIYYCSVGVSVSVACKNKINLFDGYLTQRSGLKKYRSIQIIHSNFKKNAYLMNKETTAYNKKQKGVEKDICNQLAIHINTVLKDAENKIWHGHPVWFLHDNPIVGYSKLKDCIRLLFWSGQSFDEPGLTSEGSFKAAEKRYTHVNEIKKTVLKRWLQKSKQIQWDYKNIVKRKGVLIRIETGKKNPD